VDKKQEAKYYIKDNRLYNRVSDEPIPDDEPIFILRGRDLYAINALNYYLSLTEKDSIQNKLVLKRIEVFKEFKRNNADRMKIPDAVLSEIE
jgi:hypothetical protein